MCDSHDLSKFTHQLRKRRRDQCSTCFFSVFTDDNEVIIEMFIFEISPLKEGGLFRTTGIIFA